MSSLEDIQGARQKKYQALREYFGEVFPAKTRRTHTLEKVLSSFAQLLKNKKKIIVTGRVRSLRPHGGSIFLDIEENGMRLQAFLRKEDMAQELFDLFIAAVDVGDILELTGTAYVTKRDEKSILVNEWRPLVKSFLPLPEKWHGLQDKEERFRKRALDLLANPETRQIFLMRSRMIAFIREYLNREGFIEVETPVLQHIPGGASAKPFMTHHNALDIDLYLRVAPELFLKRMLVGGFTKVYEIARNFRNEGIDVTHNPEFTMLEVYMAYEDYESTMSFVELFMEELFSTLLGKKKEFDYQGEKISVKTPFKKLTFFDSLSQYALLPDIEAMKHEDLVIAARRLGVDVAHTMTAAAIMEDIFRKAVRPKLQQPTFIYDWPGVLLPLAKRSLKNPNLVESFQLYIGGLELVKAFSELNDPIDQRARFEEQESLRAKGDEEASRLDEDFLENLEYGMPPAGGFGIGLDRLALLLTNTHNLREVILFPTLRLKE